MLKIFKSLIVLLLVSTLLSLPFAASISVFGMYFAFFTILQIIAWNVYQQIVRIKLEKLRISREAELSAQGIETRCPCSKNNKIFIPIRLNQDNSFKCLDCKKTVSVAVNVKTFLTTEPIDLETSDNALNALYDKVVKEKVEIKDGI